MFTGLVEDVGTVARADRRSDALVLVIRPSKLPVGELVLGESVCHDGACLTVTDITRDTFTVLAGAETLARTTLGALRVGKRVNLERSLRVGDRMGGHWVTGHIDDTGELALRRDLGANLVLGFRPKPSLLRYIVEKGSVAVAGVSLTVNAVGTTALPSGSAASPGQARLGDADTFSIAIIPHTRDHTTLGDLAIGDRVNLEVDILAKHIEKLLGKS
jgi:riboflavin synthase